MFQKKRFHFGLVVTAMLISSSTWHSQRSEVLNSEDIEEEWSQRSEGALYQWKCFLPEEISYELVKDGQNEIGEPAIILPQMQALRYGQFFTFFMHGNEDESPAKVLSIWKEIATLAPSDLCVYAEYLEDEAGKGGLWILHKIKSEIMEWDGFGLSVHDVWPKKKAIGEYKIVISREFDDMGQSLTILKNEKVVYQESEIDNHYTFGSSDYEGDVWLDPLSGTDVTGNNIPNLVITNWTGGNHCCVELSIFELGTEFKLITKIAPFTMGFKFIDYDGDGIPEIEFYEEAIMERFSCAAESPPGRVVLKYMNGQYSVSRDLMEKARHTSLQIAQLVNEIKNSFTAESGVGFSYEFLKIMLDLSYSGNLDDALEIAERVMSDQKQEFNAFKRDFIESLKNAEYWNAFNEEQNIRD